MSRNSWMASLRALVFGSAHRSSARRRRSVPVRRTWLGLESLEERLAPAVASFLPGSGSTQGQFALTLAVPFTTTTVSTPSASQIQINLSNDTFTMTNGAANSPYFTVSPDGHTLTITTAQESGVAAPPPKLQNFDVNLGNDSLTFGLASSNGVSNVAINQAPKGGVIQFGDIDLNSISISGNLTVTEQAGAATSVVVAAGASITTTGGAISLSGQGSGGAGVQILGSLNAGQGSITLTGTTNEFSLIGGPQAGVLIQDGQLSAASVNITGNAGLAGSGIPQSGNYPGEITQSAVVGVDIDAGSTITAMPGGSVSIQGTGGSGSVNLTAGVLVNGAVTTGTGGKVTIQGTAGLGSSAVGFVGGVTRTQTIALGGVSYTFDLAGNGVLWAVSSSGYQIVRSGVQSIKADSANSSLYVLDSSSALWRYTSLAGTPTLAGSSAQSFDVGSVGGVTRIIYLSSTDMLMDAGGAHPTPISTVPIQSFKIASLGNGELLALTSTGVLQQLVSGTTWTTLDATHTVQSFKVGVVDGVSQLFELTSNGLLQEYVSGATWQPIGSTSATPVLSFDIGAVGGVGSLVYLDSSGTLYQYISAAPTAASPPVVVRGVQSFQLGNVSAVNSIVYLDSSGTLWASTGAGTSPTKLDVDVQSFSIGAVGGASNLFDLSSGSLKEYVSGATWEALGTNVQSFKIGSLGGGSSVFFQDAFGGLYDYNGSSSSTLAESSFPLFSTPVGIGIQSFKLGAINAVNSLFYLDADNTLWQLTSPGGAPTQVAAGVQPSYTVGSLNGVSYLFFLDSNSELWSYQGGAPARVASGMLSFKVGAASGVSSLYALNSSGVLWQYTSLTATPTHVAQDVESFDLASINGLSSVFYLSSAVGNGATLYEYNGTSSQALPTDSNNQYIQSFKIGVVGGVSTLLYVDSNGSLVDYNTNSILDVGVGPQSYMIGSVGGSSYLFDLDSSGDLKEYVNGSWISLSGNIPVQSFNVGVLGGNSYLVALTSSGVLEEYVGGSTAATTSNGQAPAFLGFWQTLNTAVTSFKIVSLNSVNTLVDLNAAGALQEFSGGTTLAILGNGYVPDYYLSAWQTIDTAVQSFKTGTIGGVSRLFDLDSSGNLKQYVSGATWHTLTSDVNSFDVASLAGTTSVWWLDASNNLWSDTGSTPIKFAGNVSSFKIGSLQGTSYLVYATNSTSKTLLEDNGVDPTLTLDTSAGPYSFATIAGVNYLLDINTVPNLAIVSVPPATMNVLTERRGPGATNNALVLDVGSFDVSPLNGVTNLYYTTSTGELYWYQPPTVSSNGTIRVYGPHLIQSNVKSFQIVSLSGVNYLISLSSNGVLSSWNGSSWTVLDSSAASAFKVTNLGGSSTLVVADAHGVSLTTADTTAANWDNIDPYAATGANANLTTGKSPSGVNTVQWSSSSSWYGTEYLSDVGAGLSMSSTTPN